jgi:hypothetical protein
MTTKHRDTKKRTKQTAAKARTSHVDEVAQNDEETRPDRTAGQNGAVDQKRNDEQQYHAGGVAHDPHNETQARVDSGDPDAGDLDEVSRSDSAPFNKTYGRHD